MANALAAGAVSEIAQRREIRDALQWLTREKHWITDIQLQLCRVPAPTFLEQKRAEWMAEQFREYGWRAHLDPAGNVVATLAEEGDDALPYIALTAHLDTVFAPRLREDIYIDSDGKLRGPGVADNGAGLAALLATARALSICGLPEGRVANPVLVANVGEEGEGNLSGIRYLCNQSKLAKRVAAYVVVDGAHTDHITVRALGSRRFDLTFTGNGGHSWSDSGIGNPVHALARAITFFTETPMNGGPRSAINVGVMEGGASVNAIASQARAKVDIRSESNARIDELVVALHDAAERAQDFENQRAASGKVSGRLKEIGSRPAARLPENAAILQFARSVDGHLGIRAHLECSSTDANVPLSLGIPALSIGAGGQGGGAHTPAEWFSPEGRDLGLKRILLLLITLLRYGAA
jgi:acetylornithine deacetylase/succinyl-diaminopimelate desuccinylase-like protein